MDPIITAAQLREDIMNPYHQVYREYDLKWTGSTVTNGIHVTVSREGVKYGEIYGADLEQAHERARGYVDSLCPQYYQGTFTGRE